MTEWVDSAVVLNMGRFRENDVWLKLLTRNHGLMHTFAFGGSRSKRRFGGCLDLLNVLRVQVVSSRNKQFLHLTEATLQGGPRRIRSDFQRFGSAMNCIRFLEALNVPSDTSEKTFHLLCNMLQWFESCPVTPSSAFPVLFRLRLISEQGYAPFFSVCSHCGQPLLHGTSPQNMQGNLSFALAEGTVYCVRCAQKKQNTTTVPLSATGVAVLTKVQQMQPALWNLENDTTSSLRDAVRVADDIVRYHVGLVWEHGRFQKH